MVFPFPFICFPAFETSGLCFQTPLYKAIKYVKPGGITVHSPNTKISDFKKKTIFSKPLIRNCHQCSSLLWLGEARGTQIPPQ